MERASVSGFARGGNIHDSNTFFKEILYSKNKAVPNVGITLTVERTIKTVDKQGVLLANFAKGQVDAWNDNGSYNIKITEIPEGWAERNAEYKKAIGKVLANVPSKIFEGEKKPKMISMNFGERDNMREALLKSLQVNEKMNRHYFQYNEEEVANAFWNHLISDNALTYGLLDQVLISTRNFKLSMIANL